MDQNIDVNMAEGVSTVSLEEDLETFLSKLVLSRLILKICRTNAIFACYGSLLITL